MQIAEPLQTVIDELSKLPTIGKKTALRIALHLLKSDSELADNIVKSIKELKEKIRFCSKCFNLSVEETCDICRNTKRDRSIICVVEEASDIIAIEKSNEYNGLYHVLGGVLSPLQGTGSESLKIKELMDRIAEDEVKEIILALNPDTEGDTTSLYLANILKQHKVKITRIARGIPIGGDLEFADEATIGRAFLGRVNI
ncbi:MAG: recombination protein RecR [Ignavibacteria bacterium RBG_13_36_8]|nr:MAG: recombination protein RecR [Ignavibacteria bacterium RBG_13_36_8]